MTFLGITLFTLGQETEQEQYYDNQVKFAFKGNLAIGALRVRKV